MKLNRLNNRNSIFSAGIISKWLPVLLFLIFVIYDFINVDGKSHSVSDTLMNWMFHSFIAGCALILIVFIIGIVKKRNKS